MITRKLMPINIIKGDNFQMMHASSFINAEMSGSSILGFYSNLYRSKNIN